MANPSSAQQVNENLVQSGATTTAGQTGQQVDEALLTSTAATVDIQSAQQVDEALLQSTAATTLPEPAQVVNEVLVTLGSQVFNERDEDWFVQGFLFSFNEGTSMPTSVIAPIVNTGTPLAPVLGLQTPLPLIYGGTGVTTPNLIAGSNIVVTGTWPNQTISSTAGSGTLTGLGVPITVPATGAGTPYTATDGLAGMRVFNYVGTFANLPYAVNRGVNQQSTATGLSVTMERNFTSGNLMVFLMSAHFPLGGTLTSGWTNIFNNTGPPVDVAYAAWKIVSTEAGTNTVTPFTSTNAVLNQYCVIEMANINSGAPISTSSSGGTATITPSGNQLTVGFNFRTLGNGVIDQYATNSSFPIGYLSQGATNTTTVFWATPNLAYYTNNQPGTTMGLAGGAGGYVVVAIGNTSTTTNFWAPVA